MAVQTGKRKLWVGLLSLGLITAAMAVVGFFHAGNSYAFDDCDNFPENPPEYCPPPPPPHPPGDYDRDYIVDSLENQLMLKYAPMVFLHPQEQFRPSSVDWYLARVAMRFHHDSGCSDDQILPQGSVTQSNIWTQSHPTKNFLCSHNSDSVRSDTKRDVRADEGFFLQPPNTNNFDAIVHQGDPNPSAWRAYAHVIPSLYLANGIDIQYYFFYPYNDGWTTFNHEGDWEHITVTLDGNHNFYRAYYAAHNNEGKVYTAQQIMFADRFGNIAPSNQKLQGDYTHPVVLSAKGSHASYPTAGEQDRFPLPDDETGWGQLWNTYNNVVNVGELGNPQNGQTFIKYAHLWGEIGQTDITSGPYGPAWQSAWKQKEW